MKKDIEIERYDIPKVDVYKTDGTFYGTFHNSHECDMFRIKMLENDMTDDYYFVWNGIKIRVNSNGQMDKYPKYMYDKISYDFYTLQRVRKEKLEKRTEN